MVARREVVTGAKLQTFPISSTKFVNSFNLNIDEHIGGKVYSYASRSAICMMICMQNALIVIDCSACVPLFKKRAVLPVMKKLVVIMHTSMLVLRRKRRKVQNNRVKTLLKMLLLLYRV